MIDPAFPTRKDAAMTPEELTDADGMDRWAIPLFEDAPRDHVPVTEDDYPLRIESMPEEGFHPSLRFYRDAG